MIQIESCWATIRHKISEEEISRDSFQMERIDPGHPFEIYAAIDGAGYAMLAIGVSSRPPQIDVDTGSLHCFRTQRANGSWILGIRLEDLTLEAVFGGLCQDLVSAAITVEAEGALLSLFKERLELWRRLFQNGNAGLLQKFQIKGLIAELLALERFMKERPKDLEAVLMAWVGPTGADQDFQFSGSAIEIKAVSPDAEVVSIASVEQLFSSDSVELHLFELRECSPTEPGSTNLFDLASSIELTLEDNSRALKNYRLKLLEVGYVEIDYYKNVAFSLRSLRHYAVTDGFPRLIRPELPIGIVAATYSISISSIEAFKIVEHINAS